MEDKYYFIKRLHEKILWQYKPNTSQKLMYVFSTIFWVPLPILLIGVILSVLKVTDLKIMILFAILSIFSYLIAFLASLSQKDLEYIVTNKSIIILTGNSYTKIKFEDIKTLKVKHSLFSKNNGSIKILLNDKRNLLNHFDGIINVEKEYKKVSTIIIDNSNSMYNL